MALACNKAKPADPCDLLSTYDIERRTVAQDVIGVAARLVRNTLHSAEEYVATIEKNAGYITGEWPLSGLGKSAKRCQIGRAHV